MSPELRQRLTEWLVWAEAGAPDDTFVPYWGLCSNMEYRQDLYYELVKILPRPRVGRDYPFGGETVYNEEARTSTMHKNEARLAWVRQALAK